MTVTCDDWVIPYIGDLLDVHGVHPLSTRAGSLRSYVANTIAYRRRKGTAAVLEPGCMRYYRLECARGGVFEVLATTQHLNHLRPRNIRTPDLDTNQLELLGGPFEGATHTVDVHRIAIEGNKVWPKLQRKGAELYRAVVESGGVYTWVAERITGETDETMVLMFATYVGAIFRGRGKALSGRH